MRRYTVPLRLRGPATAATRFWGAGRRAGCPFSRVRRGSDGCLEHHRDLVVVGLRATTGDRGRRQRAVAGVRGGGDGGGQDMRLGGAGTGRGERTGRER